MIERILITLLCYFAAGTIHVLLFHAFTFRRKARLMQGIFAALFGVQIVLLILLPPNFIISDFNYSWALNIATFINAVVLYFLLFFFYANNYFVTDRSISIRIMIELARNEKGLTKQELFQYYNGDVVFDRRLDHMISGRFVKLIGGRYANTDLGRIFAKVFSFWKKFLNLGSGG